MQGEADVGEERAAVARARPSGVAASSTTSRRGRGARLLAAARRQEEPGVRARGARRIGRPGGRRPCISRARVVAVAVILLLLGTALAAPVVARTTTPLPHSAPREIAAFPTPETVTHEPTPSQRQSMTLDAIAATVGFAPLVPTYLPPGVPCRELQGFGWSDNKVATLSYACVWISQQARRGTSPERPSVGGGPTEEVTVGDRPAIYVGGGWVEERGQRTWREGFAQQLILERDGLIIRVNAGGTGVVPKDELIRVAASLQPHR